MAPRTIPGARTLSVVAAIKRDLKEIAALDSDLSRSGLAATALNLAAVLDNAKTSAASKASCARMLFEIMDRLRELTPLQQKGDGVDAIKASRDARRARGAET